MSGEAIYIHRLAVRRAYAKGQLSGALLRWAVSKARADGVRYLRLDSEFDRPRLRSLCERFGFCYDSDRQVGRHHVARYQYAVR